MTKSKAMRREGRNEYIRLKDRLESKKSCGRTRYWCKDNNEMDHGETVYDDVE